MLCSLNAVSVVNTVITHRVHYAEERERIVGVFSYVMNASGCRGYSYAFSTNEKCLAIIMINRVISAINVKSNRIIYYYNG